MDVKKLVSNEFNLSETNEVTAQIKNVAAEKIAERRTIVYKTLVDISTVKIIAEKLKSRLFVKFGLLKSKPKEISCVSVEKFYEPFLAVDAKYSAEYLRRREISLTVDNDVQEVKIGEQTFKPLPTSEKTSEIKIPVFERIVTEKKAYIMFDKFGNEIDPANVPHAPFEEKPEEVLNAYSNKIENLEFPPDTELQIVRSRLMEESPDIQEIVNRSFEVSDRVIMYVPYYKVTFRNLRTGEEKTVKIDGVTGKTVSIERN